MADRWFAVPVIGTGDAKANPPDPFRPKYTDTFGISGWAGQIVTVDDTDYYAARFVGTTSALDDVESHDDATSLQESGYTESDVANWLNDRTGHSYTFSEWEDRFLTGEIDV